MPDKYKKILVAVDGSEHSAKALKEAIAIAERNGAFLMVVIVLSSISFPADMVSDIWEQLEASSKTILKDAEKIISDEVLYSVHMLNGNPKAVIVRYSEEEDIDLIVMGATGKGAIERALVGSTTAYVVNHAPCNVLVVR